MIGEDPRLGSAEEGVELTESALTAWEQWLSSADFSALERYYGQEFDQLEPYIQKYFTDSWDEALARWWNDPAR